MQVLPIFVDYGGGGGGYFHFGKPLFHQALFYQCFGMPLLWSKKVFCYKTCLYE